MSKPSTRSSTPRFAILAAVMALASLPSGAATLVVANKAEASASLIDLESGEVVATLATESGPHEVAVSPDGRFALVANYGSRGADGRTLTLIDIPSAAVVKTIDLGDYARPHGVEWLDDTRAAVTVEANRALVVVDVKAGKVTQAIGTDQDVTHMVALDPARPRAYTANIGSGSITVLDLEQGRALRNVTTGDGAEGIAVAGDRIWVSNRAADTLTVLDAESFETVEEIPCEGFPIRAAASPRGQVLVTRARAGDLVIYDAEKLREIRTVAFDLERMDVAERLFGDRFGNSSVPIGVVVDPSGTRAYVAHANADVITEVDLDSGEILRFLRAGREPDGMGYSQRDVEGPGTHPALASLFEEWRAFERPPLLDGAPDYRAETMARRHRELADLQARLEAMDRSGWPVPWRVDWHLVRAEMNGMDFNIRVLKPWVRDPAFYTSVWTYQSDTPAHEGPTHHALVELWTYSFPLSAEAEERLAGELATIPPLLKQARGNLTGNARELWIAGIDDLRGQAATLAALAADLANAGEPLRDAVAAALGATESFVAWLEAEAASKTGPSGIGVENYSWYLRHVHLVPLTWEDEVRLLERELARAHTSLRLEEHRNRHLPPLDPIDSPEEFAERTNSSASAYLAFLAENDVLEVTPWMDPALRERMGGFVPEARRNFFQRAIHLEPMTLWTHFYHWWDLARMGEAPHPSPVRRGALLYNIFDSRAEGLATGVEEMMMHAGLYDDNPRVREIVWIMLAQRAARGLGSLHAHANAFTLREARDFHVRWTPRGWMREDLDLLGFEQLLYLRQPGYGTSYITGKYLIEKLLAARSEQLGEDFSLKAFFAELDATGVIPVSLIHWELTGDDSLVPGRPEGR